MATNDKEIKSIIKILETDYYYYEKFPKKLKDYLYDHYGETPWPYGFCQELFCEIQADVNAYFKGNLDITITPPLDKAKAEIQELRVMFCDAMLEIQDLKDYIYELHEILWSNGLSGSRMLGILSPIRTGTYEDYSVLRPEEFE